MAGDDAPAAMPAAPTGPLEVGLHAVARSLQLQHGLRHGDYQRYRRYCTRRLRRLRLHARLTHSHGPGSGGKGGHRGGQPQPFTAKQIAPDEAAGLREEHVLLALLGAERAWALAMQLKQDHAGGRGMPSYVRGHVIRRLRKAAVRAQQLKELVAGSSNITERTALEAEAYAAGMAALLALEQERWEEALAGLRVAHSVLSRFAEMPGASLADQDLFALKADEALQSMRYCQFQLGGDAASQQQLLHDVAHSHAHLPPALKDKLEAALAGARKEAASTMAEVVWGTAGTRIPVSSEAVRVALIKLQEARDTAAAAAGEKAEGNEEEEEEEEAVAAVFGAYSEALQTVQGELARVEKEGSGPRAEAQRAELRLLGAYLQQGRLDTTMRRTQGLIARLNAAPAGEKEQQREAELVHLYETLGQGAGEVVRLLTATGDLETPEDVLTVAQAEEACFRAHRVLHLAQFYAAGAGAAGVGKAQEQLAQALALFDRAASLAEEAEALAEEVDPRAGEAKRRALAEEAAGLRAQAKGGRVRAQALALLASLGGQDSSGKGAGASEEEALAAAMAALSLAAKAAGSAAEGEAASAAPAGSSSSKGGKAALHRTLLERLGDLDGGREAEGFGIARVPPTGLTPVRAKPPLFDMAYNFFLDQRLPDLAVKAGLPPSKKKQGGAAGGGGGGLFGWLRG